MLKVAGMVNKLGHYRGTRGLWDGSPQQLGRLEDAYCDSGYYYDPSVDNCVPAQENSSVCDIGYHWDITTNGCTPDVTGGYCDDPAHYSECNWTYDTTPDQTLPTDGGNSQIWAQIIAAAGKIATGVVQATSTQYRTSTGLYSYGTGPYSGLTPALAQQYLASRSAFGGISTNTMLLVGGGLLLMMFMMMKR